MRSFAQRPQARSRWACGTGNHRLRASQIRKSAIPGRRTPGRSSTRSARGGEPAVRCRSSPISIVPCRESMRGVASTGKEVLIRLSSSRPKVFVDGQASLVREFEPHGAAACLLLVDGCPIHGVGARSHIIDAQGTTSQSRSLLSMARLNSARSRLRSAICKLCSDGPDVTWHSGGFGSTSFPVFQGERGDDLISNASTLSARSRATHSSVRISVDSQNGRNIVAAVSGQSSRTQGMESPL